MRVALSRLPDKIDTGYLIATLTPRDPPDPSRDEGKKGLSTPEADHAFDPGRIAAALVAARRQARALAVYPGPTPSSLAEGYAVQEAAIGLWPDTVAGWKAGGIPLELQSRLGAERVVGPIFRAHVWPAGAQPARLPVIPGGFAAIEAEYVYRLGRDAPADKLDWMPEEALALADAMLVGVELAGSPMAAINRLGPTVVASDFGNNAGLIVGPVAEGWRERPDDWPACEVHVDGRLVGAGSPAALPGGPPAGLAFVLQACAVRGRPLTAGQLVTTGAASGVHDIRPGQSARVVFAGVGEIHCVAEVAAPVGAAP